MRVAKGRSWLISYESKKNSRVVEKLQRYFLVGKDLGQFLICSILIFGGSCPAGSSGQEIQIHFLKNDKSMEDLAC